MLAFAANSVLCRMALGNGLIDPGSFTTIRLLSGAFTLVLLLRLQSRPLEARRADLRASTSLFVYAICFSYAYVDLTTATGALILFGSVQLTMTVSGLRRGDRPTLPQWVGVVTAVVGLLYLLLPGVESPSITGAVLMSIAGVAWGNYSMRGKLARQPVVATARNFVMALPLALITSITLLPTVYLSNAGVLLAVASGSLASGLGYVIWYSALPSLRATTAATVQLSVPVLAALAGVWLLAEPLSERLLIAALLILGGIWLVSRRQVKD